MWVGTGGGIGTGGGVGMGGGVEEEVSEVRCHIDREEMPDC